MFCPACGRAISDSSRYCPYCNEYVKNAPREEHRKPLETEAFRRREERIEAMRRSNRRRKRLYGLLIAVIVLILAAVAVAAFVQHFRETHPAPELTTEEKRTTEPLTAPSTHAVSAGHDSETLAGFDEATARFLSLMETGVDELPLGSKVPADEGYGSFAYYDESDSGLVYILTAEKDRDSARLREIGGSIDLILPGRSNYTFDELSDLLGSAVEKSGSQVIYSADGMQVRFTAAFGGADGLLDGFRFTTDESADLPAETTEDPEQALRDDPEAYFKNETKKSYVVKTEGGKLNVRSFAGTDHSVVATLANGSRVTAYGSYEGWMYIESEDGQKGWVLGDYLSEPETPAE